MGFDLSKIDPKLREQIIRADQQQRGVTVRNKAAYLPAGPAIPNPEQRECAQALAGGNEGEAPGSGLRHCRFTLRRKKLLDVDAKYASVKDLLDSLTISGVIRGDREGEITLEVNQEKCGKGEAETTVIEVYETSPPLPPP